MKPVCEKCKNPEKLEMVIIGDLENKVLCKDCFEEDKKEIFQEIYNKKGAPMMGMNPMGQQKVNPDDFLINLNELVKENFEPVLFRNTELSRVVQILLRKTKNNPVLIGEAGVGKTAIAELLAHEIVKGSIPRLKEHTVYSLDMSSFMSGTKFRGEFEEKFKALMKKLDSKSILFIDEMHLVMGAGGSSQSEIDFSNLLKPYLTKGKIKVFGATTLNEYREIEKDPAFTRRFQPVKVEPLNAEQTHIILQNLLPSFQDHHGVEVLEDCLELIVELADEYILDRNFPDKAIDVLDEACSLVSINYNTIPAKEIKELETEFNELVSNLNISNSDLLKQKIAETKKLRKVSSDIILTVVENMTSIPVSKLTTEEKSRLLNLENQLSNRLIGQEAAIKTLAKAVRRSRFKLKKKKKPTVLFFAGPTGVGKTESVKALAESLFGSEDAMHRFDMSEYMEEHSISKLIGSPPGFVGHEEEGQLTEKIRRNPYSIVLLDEFEKSHPKVANLFLQAFDDGRLTDSKGRTIDFRNTLIILTSNIGVTESRYVGFNSDQQKVNEDKTSSALEKNYPPEFLNRIDEVITFNELKQHDIEKIVDLRINEYQVSLLEKGIELKLEDDAKSYLATKGYSSSMGARPLSRIITREVEDLIIDHMLMNENIHTLVLTEKDGELQIS